jgi:hypothetical protein
MNIEPTIGYWPALLFTLYYVAVTTFWLTHIINALIAKAIMRVLSDPEHSWRYGLVVHFWQIVYTAGGLIGLITISGYLGLWVWWLDGLYALYWLLFLGGSIIRLTSPEKYGNVASQNEFLDLIPPGAPTE